MTLTIEQAWSKYERMIISKCWSFKYSTGIDFNDLLGHAKETFMKAYFKYVDKPIEEFGKILNQAIYGELIKFTRREKRYGFPLIHEESYTPQYMRFNDLLDTLSEESRKAVERLFKTRKKIKNRTEFSSLMKDNLDYNYPTVWKCMKEIKEVLRNF